MENKTTQYKDEVYEVCVGNCDMCDEFTWFEITAIRYDIDVNNPPVYHYCKNCAEIKYGIEETELTYEEFKIGGTE